MNKLHEITGPQYFGKSKKKSIFQEGDKSTPGPGSHSPNKMSNNSEPQWKIGESNNRHSYIEPHRAKIPSPQHYKLSYQEVDKSSKKMSILQSTYESKPVSLNMKNCYEANHSFTKTAYPQFSFGYFKQTNYSTLAPGPGTYDLPHPKNIFNRTQSGFSIGERPPPYGQQAKFPSPNKYQTISIPTSPKYSFGKAGRVQNKSKDPPARFYDLQSKKPVVKLGRGRSTEYRREPTFLTPNEYPAPNAYHNQLKQKISNGVIDRSLRRPLQSLQMVDVPSAEKYAVHRQIQRAKAQSFIKDDRHLQLVPQDIPGPGAYGLKSTLQKIGGAIAKKQQSSQIQKVVPGAAAYHPKDTVTRKKAHSTLMLRSNRVDFTKTFTGAIGPGQYDIYGHLNGELGKMPKSPRNSLHSPDKNPGVGNYIIPSLIGQLPKYCTSPKKILENGFTTFYQRQKLSKLKRQKSQKAAQVQKEHSQQEVNYNPEVRIQ